MGIQDILSSLGLTNNEIQIYLTVLGQGQISPADVAQLTKINRSTVYAAGKQLEQKGFLSIKKDGKKQYFCANPLKELNDQLDREKRNFHQREHLFRSALAELEPLTKNQGYSVPHISFIEEQRINEYLYERMEVWASNVLETNGIWYGFQDHTFVESYAENLHWAWRQSYFDQMQLQLFTNNKESEKNIESFGYERRRMRFWDGEDITYTLWIVGRSIVVISTRKRPHYLFEIHDTQLAQNLAKTFKQLWV